MKEQKVEVVVSYKPEVNDPQVQSLNSQLRLMGYEGVEILSAGKYFQLTIESDLREEAERVAYEAAQKLLAHPIVEEFQILPKPDNSQ